MWLATDWVARLLLYFAEWEAVFTRKQLIWELIWQARSFNICPKILR